MNKLVNFRYNSIAFIINELGYGGQERQMSHAIKTLRTRGWHISLFVWISKSKENINAYEIKQYSNSIYFLEGTATQKIRRIRDVISNQENLKLIQSWSMPTNFYCVVAAKNTGIKAIGCLRTDFNWLWNSVRFISKFKLLFDAISPAYLISNNKKGLISLSRFRTKFLRKGELFFLSNRIEIPSNLNSDRFKSQDIYSVSVGSLLVYKRWDFLIDVVFMLKKNGLNIIHKHAGHNGPERGFLEEKVKELQLEKNFEFLGQMDDLSRVYNSAQLLIHTAEVEGTPNVVLEAMSYGLPVFSSNCGDVNHYVDCQNGFVFNHYNVKIWADTIIQNLKSERYRDLGECSRYKAEEKLSIESLYEDLINVYGKILK